MKIPKQLVLIPVLLIAVGSIYAQETNTENVQQNSEQIGNTTEGKEDPSLPENSDSGKGNTQSNPKKKYFTYDKDESMEKYVDQFDHRLKFRFGAAIGQLDPAVLNETVTSWLYNSTIHSAQNPGMVVPPAYPISKQQLLYTTPQYEEVSYGWKNRIDVSWSKVRNLGKFTKGHSAAVRFFTPRTSDYWASAFEGKRLLGFAGVSENIRVSYTHPILGWLMIGPSVNIHHYNETDTLSLGSYSTTRPSHTPPSQTTWSIGGTVDAKFSMNGILPGILMKLQLLPWWEIRSRIEILNRSGSFSMAGSQILAITNSQSQTSFGGIFPSYRGSARDKGTILMVESSFRYCRFTLDIGMIRQDFRRSYSSYLGNYASVNVNPNDVSAQTYQIGYGETSHSFKQTITQFYIMPGFSFHFDKDGIY